MMMDFTCSCASRCMPECVFPSACLRAHLAQTLSCKRDATLQGTTGKSHPAHKQLCPAKQRQNTLLGTGDERQPSQMFNIRLLVSPPHYETQTSETNNKC